MGPITSVRTVLFKKYATFSGRASRSEFWWFTLFCYPFLIFGVVFFGSILEILEKVGMLDQFSDPVFLVVIAIVGLGWLALLMPSFAVTARRLHDRGWSGWWILAYYGGTTIISLIPLLGAFLAIAAWIGVVVLLSQVGDCGVNRFGANPLIKDVTHDVFS